MKCFYIYFFIFAFLYCLSFPQYVAGVWAGCTKTPSLFITTPKEMEALSGSCLQIPCDFHAQSDFDNKRETFAVWIRRDPRFSIDLRNVIFNSSETGNRYQMHITGNLSSRNCTTFFSRMSPNYTDTYYLRIENKPFMATASCNPLKITVRGRRVLFLSPQICCCCSLNYRFLDVLRGAMKTHIELSNSA